MLAVGASQLQDDRHTLFDRNLVRVYVNFLAVILTICGASSARAALWQAPTINAYRASIDTVRILFVM